MKSRAAATTAGTTQRSRAMADASDASSGQWKLIGPQPLLYTDGTHHSGLANALAVDPRNSSVVYLGTDGGVWKTTDGGQAWIPLTDNVRSMAIRALVLDPSNPDVVYAGTAFSNEFFCSDGKGILKSTDGGATWTHLPGPLPYGPGLEAFISSLAVSPSDANVLLAVAQSASPTGLYRSADGGNTWNQVLAPSTSAGLQVLFDPADGSIAYASLDTVYKSTDGGNTWTTAAGSGGNVLPASHAYHLATDPLSPQTLYAGTGVSTATYPAYLFKTVDGGQNWTPLPFPWWSWIVWVDPANPNVVVSGSLGLAESLDGGSTWNSVGNPPHGIRDGDGAFGGWQRALSSGGMGRMVGHRGRQQPVDIYKPQLHIGHNRLF
jgi:hypothetical protein